MLQNRAWIQQMLLLAKSLYGKHGVNLKEVSPGFSSQ